MAEGESDKKKYDRVGKSGTGGRIGTQLLVEDEDLPVGATTKPYLTLYRERVSSPEQGGCNTGN